MNLDLRKLGAYLKLSLPILTDADYYTCMTEANTQVRYPPNHRDRRERHAVGDDSVPASQISNPMQYIDTDDPAVIRRFEQVNDSAHMMYKTILDKCPQSAERTLAIRSLQQCRMWANAAIAFDGKTYPL